MARTSRQFILIMTVLGAMIATLLVVDWFYLFRQGRSDKPIEAEMPLIRR